MKPLWIVYNNKLMGGDTLGIIFKNGDGRNQKWGGRFFKWGTRVVGDSRDPQSCIISVIKKVISSK